MDARLRSGTTNRAIFTRDEGFKVVGRKILMAALAALTVFTADADSTREVTRAGRKWQLTPGCRVDGNLLTVEIPRERWGSTEWARTEVDLSPYAKRGFEACVRVCAENIVKPTEPWLGFKFMLRWCDRFSGAMHYPGAGAPLGSFPWRTVSFRQDGAFRGADGPGVLHLGLQGSSGRLVFDLDSLKFGDLRPIWPVTNESLRCAYTIDFASRPAGRGVMSPSGRDMNEDDFRTLADWGVKLLRFQMVRDWHGVNANQDLAEFDRWLDGRLDHFKTTLLPLARKYGIAAVLDMHVTPGGRSASHETNMFFDRRYARHFVKAWRRIAERFVGEKGIWAYDLVNEPHQQTPSPRGIDGWNLQREAAEAIRAVDAEIPILIEANSHASPDAFRNLSPLALTNVAYEVHMYIPDDFTHQGIAGFASGPNRWPDKSRGWNREYLRSVLAPVREFQLKHGARIYVGEFSTVAWAEGAEIYLADCIALFEEYGWDWTYHAFREWKGWSVEHEGTDINRMTDSGDNPRKKALLKGFNAGPKITKE